MRARVGRGVIGNPPHFGCGRSWFEPRRPSKRLMSASLCRGPRDKLMLGGRPFLSTGRLGPSRSPHCLHSSAESKASSFTDLASSYEGQNAGALAATPTTPAAVITARREMVMRTDGSPRLRSPPSRRVATMRRVRAWRRVRPGRDGPTMTHGSWPYGASDTGRT
jgi:hypothetical protein